MWIFVVLMRIFVGACFSPSFLRKDDVNRSIPVCIRFPCIDTSIKTLKYTSVPVVISFLWSLLFKLFLTPLTIRLSLVLCHSFFFAIIPKGVSSWLSSPSHLKPSWSFSVRNPWKNAKNVESRLWAGWVSGCSGFQVLFKQETFAN